MTTEVDGLAQGIALVLLAEWIAIDHDETRLQAGKYTEEAQGLADWLYTIGYRLQATGMIDDCPFQGREPIPESSMVYVWCELGGRCTNSCAHYSRVIRWHRKKLQATGKA